MTSLADNYSKLEHANLDSQDSDFCLRYLVENNFLFKKNSKPNATALAVQKANQCRMTSLFNGAVYFPYDVRHIVLSQIARDRLCENSSKSYWNQIAYETDGVRLVVDVDATRVIGPDELDKFGLYLSETLCEYFPMSTKEQPIDVVCSVCGPRLKKGVQSSGVHFIAHVQVTFDQARQIIYAFKLRLYRDRLLDMSAIEIDAGIYKTNTVNLRLIYNHKIENCPVCNDQTADRICCSFCDRSGLVTSNHTYTPQKCFRASAPRSTIDDERFKELHKDVETVFQSNSIWSDPDELRPDYTKPERHPLHTCETTAPEPQAKTKAPRGGKSVKHTILDKGNKAYDMLQGFLWRISLQQIRPWDGIVISDIKITGKSSATIAVTGQGSNWCVYANKDHGNNRIFFTLRKSTGKLAVRCHSTKHGCQEKSIMEFEVPMIIINHIFQGAEPNGLNFKALFPIYDEGSRKRGGLPSLQDDRIKRAKEREQLNEVAKLSAFYKTFK